MGGSPSGTGKWSPACSLPVKKTEIWSTWLFGKRAEPRAKYLREETDESLSRLVLAGLPEAELAETLGGCPAGRRICLFK